MCAQGGVKSGFDRGKQDDLSAQTSLDADLPLLYNIHGSFVKEFRAKIALSSARRMRLHQ